MRLNRSSDPFRREAHAFAARLRFRLGGNYRVRRRVYAALKTLSVGIPYAALVEPALLQTTQVEITIPDLPPAMDGYRIVHLTDLHYNISAGKSFVRRVVQRSNALDPDLIALTGDFITHKTANMHRCLSLLSDLRAPDGCWVVRGNHDYPVSLREMRALCRDYGFRLLENERVTIRPSRLRAHTHGAGLPEELPRFTLAGVGDMWEGECLPGRALERVDQERPVILLSHHGQVAELLPPGTRADLILSGHTHGGQIRAMGRALPILCSGSNKYVSGLVRTGRHLVYISRGVGTSALRLRWNCRPEIALIHLHRSNRLEGEVL